jgi:hypothetical protein
MELNDAIKYALDGKALLFIGAGFSIDKDTKNQKGTPLKSGSELSKHLLNLCQIDDANPIPPLDLAAQYCRDTLNVHYLIDELKELFTVTNCAEWQKEIINIPWLRIYTTNYDDLSEFCRSKYNNLQNLKKLKSVTIEKKISDIHDKSNLCIHLNGYIDELNESNIDNDFKLTSHSYAHQSFIDSEWSNTFRYDIKLAKAIFFVGYSMYDLDIQRTLNATSNLSEKTFFFIGSDDTLNTKLTSKKIEPYGTDSKMSAQQLAEAITEIRINYVPRKEHDPFYSFIKISSSYNVAIDHINSSSVFDLLMYGNISPELIAAQINNPKLNYIVIRDKIINKAIDIICNEKKDIIIHADIGNGKTVFCEHIALSLLERGHSVYFLRNNLTYITELAQLVTYPDDIVIIIENFFLFEDVLRDLLRQRKSNIRLILTARTPDYEVRDSAWLDLYEDNSESFYELDINEINEDEAQQLIYLINYSKLWGHLASLDNLKKSKSIRTYKSQFNSIVLGLIKSPDMELRIKEYFNFSTLSQEKTKLLTTIFILQILGFDFETNEISELSGVRFSYNKRYNNDDVFSKLIIDDGSRLKSKSSILAQYCLNNLIAPSIIFSSLNELLVNAYAMRSSNYNKLYMQLLSDLFLFRNLTKIIPKDVILHKRQIEKYYDKIGMLGHQNNPMYHLQFAIAYLFTGELDKSEVSFDTAYSVASKIPNYNNYKIDNHYARYLLEYANETYDPENSKNAFNKSRSILERQMADKNNRHYPYRVASLYADFYNIYSSTMSSSELQTFKATIARILNHAEKAPKHRDVTNCIRALSSIPFHH